jgi:hypothetical protein
MGNEFGNIRHHNVAINLYRPGFNVINPIDKLKCKELKKLWLTCCALIQINSSTLIVLCHHEHGVPFEKVHRKEKSMR